MIVFVVAGILSRIIEVRYSFSDGFTRPRFGKSRKGEAIRERRLGRFPDLADKTFVVTGRGSGMGEAIVWRFGARGSKTAFIDIKEAERKIDELGATP